MKLGECNQKTGRKNLARRHPAKIGLSPTLSVPEAGETPAWTWSLLSNIAIAQTPTSRLSRRQINRLQPCQAGKLIAGHRERRETVEQMAEKLGMSADVQRIEAGERNRDWGPRLLSSLVDRAAVFNFFLSRTAADKLTVEDYR